MHTRSKIKVHGIFRSGTNLAKYLLLDRMDCQVVFNEGGHKHLPLPFLPKEDHSTDIPIVVCVKNPLANLVSLYKYANSMKFLHFECGRSWHEFLTEKFVIRMNGDIEQPAYRFNNPVDYWNAFYYNAFSLPSNRHQIFKYEEILTNPDAALNALSKMIGTAALHTGQVRLPESTMAKTKDGEGMDVLTTASVFSSREYYLSRAYEQEFNTEQREWVISNLDQTVISHAGYNELLDSSEQNQ